MVKTYTIPNCPMCEELKSYMRNSHINYEEANVESDPRALARMTMEGIEQYPAVEINGMIYSGDVSELKNIVSR
mgnify:FL=1